MLVYWPLLNQSMDAIAEMLADDTVIMGLADAGAHVGQILDASQPTWFLTHWGTRPRVADTGAVQRLSSDTAAFVGLADRSGTVVPGMAADLNVIDWEGLPLPVPEFVHDLPRARAGIQRADGYVATVINGSWRWRTASTPARCPVGSRAPDPTSGDRTDAVSPHGQAVRPPIWPHPDVPGDALTSRPASASHPAA